MRSRALRSLLACSAALSAACGPPKEIAPPAGARTELACSAPIGTIHRESCTAVADEFGALSVSGALKQAGKDTTGALRAEAIRHAAALGNRLKQERIELCEAYNACKVTPAEHAAKDRKLATLMTSLLALWEARQFADPHEVARFDAAVRALGDKLDGRGEVSAPRPAGQAPATPAADAFQGEKLTQLPVQDASFSTNAGAVTVRTPPGGLRTVLRSAPALRLLGGHRYLIKVIGSYVPAAPALLAPGDQVVGRVRYRAEQPAQLSMSLRSIEDAEASEASASWNVAAGEQGQREATLTASPGQSGFFLTLGARGEGSLDLESVELVREGRVLAALRAGASSEPRSAADASRAPALIETSCTPAAEPKRRGKRSLRCRAGADDLVTIARPSAYLEMSVRSASGDRATVRTQSLDGGRSVDATLTEDAEIVIAMAGEGTATIRSIEVRDLSP